MNQDIIRINQTKSIKKRSKRSQIWFQVLQVIGESVTSLSGRQIETKWYKNYYILPLDNTTALRKNEKVSEESLDSHGKRKYRKKMSYGDIYRIIRELAGFGSRKTVKLCKFNKIIPNSKEMDQEYLREFVNRVRKIVRLTLLNYQENDLIRTEFQIDSKQKEIALFFKRWSRGNKQWEEIVMKIKLKFTETTSVLLEIQGISLPLYGKNDKNGELWLYLLEDDIESDHPTNKTPFIEYMLSKNAQNNILKLREGMESTPFHDAETQEITRDWYHYWPETESDKKHLFEIQMTKNNPRNFRYFLSIRGFLVYLLKARKDRQINKVIQSLVQNSYTKNDYPFLWNYQAFDKIYGTYYKIRILKEVSFELQNQLATADKSFLIYWITKRFHFYMIYAQSFPSTGPIYKIPSNLFWRDVVRRKGQLKIKSEDLDELFREVKEYDIKMLEILKEYQEKELNLSRMLLENSQKELYPNKIHQ